MAKIPTAETESVGSYWDKHYYGLLIKEPHNLFRLYWEHCSIMHVYDYGNSSSSINRAVYDRRNSPAKDPKHFQKVYAYLSTIRIDELDMSSVNTVQSWGGSTAVVVCGYMKLEEFPDWKRFVQNFAIVQRGGISLVVNDILDVIDTNDVIFQENIVKPLTLKEVDPQFYREPPAEYGLPSAKKSYKDMLLTHSARDAPS